MTARSFTGPVEMCPRSAVLLLRQKLQHRLFDSGQMTRDRRVRIDLHAVQLARLEHSQLHRGIAHLALPQVPEVVGGVCRHHQHALPRTCPGQAERRGQRGLAHTPLAADEQHPTAESF